MLRSEIRGTPDLIHVEQPWLFAFARRYVSECADESPTVLYGSQNIEHLLKQAIVAGYLGKEHAREAARLVLECESAAAGDADLVCAASVHDARWLRQFSRREVIIAENGVRRWVSTNGGINEANAMTGHRKYALYCASAHPPNIAGFFELFGRGVGCFAPDERLVVAGSAGPNIGSDARFTGIPGLRDKYISAGEVSDSCLHGLLDVAHVIVLPITYGEGTNLKTAEALWAGHHIVATPTAMRGFEQFSDSQGLVVCTDAASFRRAVRSAMESGPLDLTHDERQRREALTWDRTLVGLVQHVELLDGSRVLR